MLLQSDSCSAVIDLIINVACVRYFNRIYDEHGHSGERGAENIISRFPVSGMPRLLESVEYSVPAKKQDLGHYTVQPSIASI